MPYTLGRITVLGLTLPKYSLVQKLTDKINRIARENLTGIRVIRAYHAEQYQTEKFHDTNNELTNVNKFTNRLLAIQQPGMRLIMSGLTLAIYWVGVYMLDAAEMSLRLSLFSDMVVFSSYAQQIIMAFMMLTMTLLVFPRAAVSYRRIREVVETLPSITDGSVEHSELYEQGEIEFHNVCFRYPDAQADALHDISFSAKKGETIAFIGATGSGKSSLINLLMRFYDATDGCIKVDGVDIRDYNLKTLREKMGYVPQRATLFSGNIATNVAYGSKSTEHSVLQALEIAQASAFVEALPDQEYSIVAQGGSNLSGGQKQRVSIARAIHRRPEFYLFDDSFSALDLRTDRDLRGALKRETRGVTTLIVAQRIGTIMDADQIIVLDHGQVAGKGTHRQLLQNCDVYREIAQSQHFEIEPCEEESENV